MATIGVLGGGQLGRMLALDAQRHGHAVIVRTDEPPGGPAAQVATDEISAPYNDDRANRDFADRCDVVTVEFENIPTDLISALEQSTAVRPGVLSVSTCQQRVREKTFLREHGLPHAAFDVVHTSQGLQHVVQQFGQNAVAKTAAFGYDGKGQVRFRPDTPFSAIDAWAALGAAESVVEQWIDHRLEISVVGARSVDGRWVAYEPGENVHVCGILDYTVVPARIPIEVAREAQRIAGTIAASLDHVGVIGVEFFVLDDWTLLVNEMAPRPHNSGHHTVDACATSQFGQQWRIALGLAPADPSLQCGGVAMVNLLGDLWAAGELRWEQLDGLAGVHLHLYGKASPRAGRKMGHLTVCAESAEAALEKALALRSQCSAQ